MARNRFRYRPAETVKGAVTVVGRKSPVSLYSEQHAFEADTVYDQRDPRALSS